MKGLTDPYWSSNIQVTTCIYIYIWYNMHQRFIVTIPEMEVQASSNFSFFSFVPVEKPKSKGWAQNWMSIAYRDGMYDKLKHAFFCKESIVFKMNMITGRKYFHVFWGSQSKDDSLCLFRTYTSKKRLIRPPKFNWISN